MRRSPNGAGEFWGAHAPRVLLSAPSPKALVDSESAHPEKVREREGALASTRGASAPRTKPVRALRLRCELS